MAMIVLLIMAYSVESFGILLIYSVEKNRFNLFWMS